MHSCYRSDDIRNDLLLASKRSILILETYEIKVNVNIAAKVRERKKKIYDKAPEIFIYAYCNIFTFHLQLEISLLTLRSGSDLW